MQMLRKLSLQNAFGTTYVQNHYFEGKCLGNHHFKMHLAPNMYKIVTLEANVKEIVTSNAFDTKYVQNCYFEGKCSGNSHFKMHLTPKMYKIVTL